MQSPNEIITKWSHETKCLKVMSPNDIKQLQMQLLQMYNHVQEICKKYNLTVIVGGGGCLGAIRHNGFIPWDDDLDLVMLRPEYDRFIKLCENGILGDDYEFRYPNGNMETSCAFLKIYKKRTKYVSLGLEDAPVPHGIFLDIFPFEGIPNSKFHQKFNGIIANTLRLVSSCVFENTYRSSILNNAIREYSTLKHYFQVRWVIGSIFSFIPSKKWFYYYDRFVSNKSVKNLIGVPTGRKMYNGEIVNRNIHFPPSLHLFEGQYIKIPGKWDQYLTMMYGNYMEIPPFDKRESHCVVEFEIE